MKEYKIAAKIILDHLWDTTWIWKDSKNNQRVLDIKANKLDCPQFLTKEINSILPHTPLSARALKCCGTQVCSAIKSVTEKQRKRLYILEKLKQQNLPISTALLKKIQESTFKKPDLSKLLPELNSICVDFKKTSSQNFDGFIQLKSLGKQFGKIRIPIKFNRHSNKKSKDAVLKNSFLLEKTQINFRWESNTPNKKITGKKVGADQGYNTVLTLADDRATPEGDAHGHTLESICQTLSKKKKGSKSFHKTQIHRKNFINWSVNQLDLSDIRHVKLEDIKYLRYKSKTSRVMTHWTYSIIHEKLERRCEEEGVLLSKHPPTFKSQRCSEDGCGLVLKSNRNKKSYCCESCGQIIDADLNAARNHSLDLPEIPTWLSRSGLNRREGFIWNQSGLFTRTGEVLTVPLSKNDS